MTARPKITTLEENNARTGFFEREQFEAVRAKLSAPLQHLVTAAYITGWRVKSELQRLQWRHVDFDGGMLRLDPEMSKNKNGRVFPFTAELRALLETQRTYTNRIQRERGTVIPWVFHRKGAPIRYFYQSWATACRKAGCPGRIPHDFRRSAVRNLVRAGISERVAMTMTGHKTRCVFERYNIVSPGDLTEAARKLDEVAGTIAGTTGTDKAASG